MYNTYRDRADFLTIYIKEAHPTDEWQMESNEKDGACYRQPRSTEERVLIANDFVKRYKYSIPLRIDPISNTANSLYAGWPERLYVIDEHGVVAYKGETGPFGFHPEEVVAWLEKRFPPEEARN